MTDLAQLITGDNCSTKERADTSVTLPIRMCEMARVCGHGKLQSLSTGLVPSDLILAISADASHFTQTDGKGHTGIYVLFGGAVDG